MVTSAASGKRFFSAGAERPSRTEQLVIGAQVYPITFEQGALIYLLMRGGIEDVITLAIATAIDRRIVERLPLLEMFVWFDNEVAKYHLGKRKLPIVSASCRVFCQSCGMRLAEVPCCCGAPANYDISQPDEMTTSRRFGQVFGLGSDRSWNNIGRIAAGEATYHGGGSHVE